MRTVASEVVDRLMRTVTLMVLGMILGGLVIFLRGVQEGVQGKPLPIVGGLVLRGWLARVGHFVCALAGLAVVCTVSYIWFRPRPD